MTEITKYECDVTGEVLEEEEVETYTIRRRVGRGPFEYAEHEVHVDEKLIGVLWPQGTRAEYIGMEEGKCLGIMFSKPTYEGDVSGWYDRDDVVGPDEDFWEFIEEEVFPY